MLEIGCTFHILLKVDESLIFHPNDEVMNNHEYLIENNFYHIFIGSKN